MRKLFFGFIMILWAGLSFGAGLRNGDYRAELVRKDGQRIVFNFMVKDSVGKKILYVRNAGEKLLVDNVKTAGDSVFITMPFFESQLRAVVLPGGGLRGVWLKHGAEAYQVMAFEAVYGVKDRWPGVKGSAAAGDAAGNTASRVAGRWKAAFFTPGKTDSSWKVGEFSEKNGIVSGTFLDPTGDFRFLEGVVDGDSLRLSCFDGGHAYLFTARVSGDELVGGQYFAGASGIEEWVAKKDESAALPDEFSLAKWSESTAGPIAFTFRDLNGKKVSLSDARFKGKVILLQIMGSWCPNCMDETGFLSGFYKTYRGKGVEIIGLAYERSTDFARSAKSLRAFQQRFHVEYPILITGVTVGDPDRAKKTLPQLESIAGFPTTIFLGRDGRIVKVHTGFSGPGTGEHYEAQKKEFKDIVDEILKKG